jgi:hypothetical protein
MLLFQPYSFEDIESVVEQKKNSLFKVCVPGAEHPHRAFIKDIFFNLIDERAMTFMCKRISQSCGDIRVVFDIMKTALQMLNEKIDELEIDQFKDLATVKAHLTITMPMIVEIFDNKKGLRIKDTLKSLPR